MYLGVLEEIAARWAAIAVAVSVHSLACHFQIVLSALDSGRLGIAAVATGLAQAAPDEAVAYANERTAFGKLHSKSLSAMAFQPTPNQPP